MPDFSKLLKSQATPAERPKALPIGQYASTIASWEPGESREKKTMFVRFHFRLASAIDVDEADLAGIDLSKKQLRKDFFFTDDAKWRLDRFLMSLGLSLDGRLYEEVLEEARGQPVTLNVTQRIADNNDIFNDVADAIGEHAVE